MAKSPSGSRRPAPSLPSLECDLVMKGGVTSGVVYPSAVATIARDYRLRSIGGTSAGAIAAAAAAAMEFGRTSGRNPNAVHELDAVPRELGAEQDGQPLLSRLFEPDPPTAKLFRLLLDLQQRSARGPAAVAARLLSLPGVVAVLVAALLVLWVVLSRPGIPGASTIGTALIIFVLLAADLVPFLAALIWGPLVLRGIRAASNSGFGFCSGMARHKDHCERCSPALAEWLHSTFQSLAGLPDEEPLCFGDLWAAPQRQPGRGRDEALASAAGEGRNIDLALVASDISRAQSVEFPFLRRDDRYYVRPSDLRTLYPEAIVEWMIAHARPSELGSVELGGIPSGDLIRLPQPADLPVLFAVRPSLSFPVLFKAVRLYVLRRRAEAGETLSELWLADGGITSNFPIHLFDAPIPTRPTFCINLVYADDELQPDDRPVAAAATEPSDDHDGLSEDTAAPPDELVYMLRTNSGRLAPYTRLPPGGPAGLLRFLMRVVSTARQWNDNQLLDVPGYRDRIVHIRMRPDEGGFNLDMHWGKIADLQRRGTRAGSVISKRFLPTTLKDPLNPSDRLVLNWANHRMARFRSFLAGLEVTASRFARAWQIDHDRAESEASAGDHAEPSLETMAEEASRKPRKGQRWGYAFKSEAQGHRALDMADAVRRLADESAMVGADFINGQPTSPRPKLRLVLRPPLASDPTAEHP